MTDAVREPEPASSPPVGAVESEGLEGLERPEQATRDDAPSVDLSGKVVVVTGASGAAGPAVVRELAASGAQVVVVGRRRGPLVAVADAASQAAQASGRGGGVAVEELDLLNEVDTRRWARALIAAQGRADGLIHLVGGWRGGNPIELSDPDDWAWLQEQLVVTLIHLTREFHDALRDAGGRVAIVSSPLAQTPTATNAAYAAAKAASEAWLLALADSWRTSDAAATILQVKALLTDEMKQAHPERKFPGFTHVDELAGQVLQLWSGSAAELNGARRRLDPA